MFTSYLRVSLYIYIYIIYIIYIYIYGFDIYQIRLDVLWITVGDDASWISDFAILLMGELLEDM